MFLSTTKAVLLYVKQKISKTTNRLSYVKEIRKPLILKASRNRKCNRKRTLVEKEDYTGLTENSNLWKKEIKSHFSVGKETERTVEKKDYHNLILPPTG